MVRRNHNRSNHQPHGFCEGRGRPATEKDAPAKKSAKESKVYVDGKFLPEAEAKISVFDHGLLYGDGIFEGIRFYNGRVFRLEEHLERLWDSARSICLEIPMTQHEMSDALLETIRQNGLREGYIACLVNTRVGNLGLNPAHCNLRADHHRSDDRALSSVGLSKGLTVVTCATRRTTLVRSIQR